MLTRTPCNCYPVLEPTLLILIYIYFCTYVGLNALGLSAHVTPSSWSCRLLYCSFKLSSNFSSAFHMPRPAASIMRFSVLLKACKVAMHHIIIVTYAT